MHPGRPEKWSANLRSMLKSCIGLMLRGTCRNEMRISEHRFKFENNVTLWKNRVCISNPVISSPYFFRYGFVWSHYNGNECTLRYIRRDKLRRSKCISKTRNNDTYLPLRHLSHIERHNNYCYCATKKKNRDRRNTANF